MRSNKEFVLGKFRERLVESQGWEHVQLLDQVSKHLLEGEAFNWKGEEDLIFSWMNEFILLAKEYLNPEAEATVHLCCGKTLLGGSLGNDKALIRRAMDHFERGLSLAETVDSNVIKAEALLGLSRCAECQGEFEQAYRWLVRSCEAKENEAAGNRPKEGTGEMGVRDDFLAMVSHEVRTPMNGIVGMSELLSRMKIEGEAKGLIDVIHECGLTLSTILDDFLDSNHFVEGNIELRFESLQVNGLFNRTIRMFNLRRKPGVEFRFEWDDSVHGQIWGDPSRIRQILNNLLTNAFKFTDEGYVSCRVYNDDAYSVAFEIEDSGKGVSGELFAEPQEGTPVRAGIGLKTCRKLARMMKGDLTYRKGEDGGSVFVLTLPTEETEKTTVGIDSNAVERVSRVLVVEDTELNWKVIQLMLSNMGVHADWASGGGEAIQRFEANPYELVFMDFQMDEMDGPETTQIIRELVSNHQTDQPYIVALTADSTASYRLEELSMDDFLPKPVRIEVLEGVINRFRRWAAKGKS